MHRKIFTYDERMDVHKKIWMFEIQLDNQSMIGGTKYKGPNNEY